MGYYSRRSSGSRTNGIKMPNDRPDIARRIAAIMAQQRKGMDAPEYGKRGGRVDRRNLNRVAVGNDRVFQTRSGRSQSRLKVVVVLDLSGSMHGRYAQDAVQTAWDFILATRELAAVDLEVWGHTTGYFYGGGDTVLPEIAEDIKNRGDKTGVREGHYVAAYHLYEGRMTRQQFYRQLRDIQMSGNEDGWSLDTICRDVEKRKKSNERVLVLMVSDGSPAYAEGKHGLGHVRAVVKRWRRRGFGIVSCSVSSSLRKEAQNNMYGHEWVVPFMEDEGLTYWDRINRGPGMSNRTVVALGRVIGRALA